MDSNSSQAIILSESLALVLMQEQSSFVENVIGSPAEDAWNDL
jgi:hypothetical protein